MVSTTTYDHLPSLLREQLTKLSGQLTPHSSHVGDSKGDSLNSVASPHTPVTPSTGGSTPSLSPSPSSEILLSSPASSVSNPTASEKETGDLSVQKSLGDEVDQAAATGIEYPEVESEDNYDDDDDDEEEKDDSDSSYKNLTFKVFDRPVVTPNKSKHVSIFDSFHQDPNHTQGSSGGRAVGESDLLKLTVGAPHHFERAVGAGRGTHHFERAVGSGRGTRGGRVVKKDPIWGPAVEVDGWRNPIPTPTSFKSRFSPFETALYWPTYPEITPTPIPTPFLPSFPIDGRDQVGKLAYGGRSK